ncbi:Holliday junction branch migration protein RuvA [Fusibacter ferrireducens]|uniref:Holliday junction branch migration complex subunit RuvA n=1 Tax=Fusibacter ferrireducens TaxID=2785058 RepID=A0ABR9ZTH2_9FIRM|nr:Holliday junction branch migration protein RuvA [Fusibacter ferrireducens]MBF4693775.1 Holliday junction branch migration protein RuvA [Fusibacter ferrireducens]
MIDFIKGKLYHIDVDHIVVENNGMGYRVFTSANSISDFDVVGEEIIIHTEMIVREDAISLVGFSTKEELHMFRLLTSVSGVGTKVGIGILSSLNYISVAAIIASNDVKAMTAAHGVGKKTAERIILELKDKVGKSMLISADTQIETHVITGGVESDALEALMTLGYTRNEAQSVLKLMDISGMTVEEILKAALKKLMTQ